MVEFATKAFSLSIRCGQPLFGKELFDLNGERFITCLLVTGIAAGRVSGSDPAWAELLFGVLEPLDDGCFGTPLAPIKTQAAVSCGTESSQWGTIERIA